MLVIGYGVIVGLGVVGVGVGVDDPLPYPSILTPPTCLTIALPVLCLL